ncbi:45198_t:CDS:2, partial [Gigaspora margarita]
MGNIIEELGCQLQYLFFFNYPSFLKELSYDQFLNAAIANNCSKEIIIELFKILATYGVIIRRFVIDSCLNNHLDNIGTLALPYFSECPHFLKIIARKLAIQMGGRINLYYALSLFANVSLKAM